MAEHQSRPIAATPILVAMALGALVGWLIGPAGKVAGIEVLGFFDFLGTLFINLLKMVVVPLIAASIVTGVASIGSGRDLGRLGIKTLSFYVFTTLLAVLIALALVDLIKPGIANGVPARALLALEASSEVVNSSVQARASVTVFDTLLGIVPTNILQAASSNNLLGVMFFSVLFGFFLARIEMPYRQTVLEFWQGLFKVLMRITKFVITLAPVGVFGLTARLVAKPRIHASCPILAIRACVALEISVYDILIL